MTAPPLAPRRAVGNDYRPVDVAIRAHRPLYTYNVGGVEVTTTLSEEDLAHFYPDEHKRAGWLRRLAGVGGGGRGSDGSYEAEPGQDRPVRRNYATEGLCRPESNDPDAWLVDWLPSHGDPVNHAAAKAVCGRCPVQTECLEDALWGFASIGSASRRLPVVGIWAGTSERERETIRRRAYDKRRRSA